MSEENNVEEEVVVGKDEDDEDVVEEEEEEEEVVVVRAEGDPRTLKPPALPPSNAKEEAIIEWAPIPMPPAERAGPSAAAGRWRSMMEWSARSKVEVRPTA